MTQNEIKKAASLAQHKYRKKHGLFLVEGIHSVAELLNSTWEVESMIVPLEAERDPEVAAAVAQAGVRRMVIHRVNKKVFEHIASTESPQGAMAVAKIPGRDLRKVAAKPRILIADGVADPGNLGAMMRSALAFGFGGLMTTAGAADLFNPKAVRSSQGAMFHLAVAGHIDPQEIIAAIKPTHRLFALVPRGGEDPRSIRPPARCTLVVGAEAAGIGPEMAAAADITLTIPMPGGAESLNAAVSAAIAMYEFSRK